jgi:hypothetical protein
MKSAKQTHEQKQKPATEIPQKRNKKPLSRNTFDTERISNESDDDALCGFS